MSGTPTLSVNNPDGPRPLKKQPCCMRNFCAMLKYIVLYLLGLFIVWCYAARLVKLTKDKKALSEPNFVYFEYMLYLVSIGSYSFVFVVLNFGTTVYHTTEALERSMVALLLSYGAFVGLSKLVGTIAPNTELAIAIAGGGLAAGFVIAIVAEIMIMITRRLAAVETENKAEITEDSK